MNCRIEHPRFMVYLLFFTVVALGLLLDYDNAVLADNIAALRYCIEQGSAVR